MEAWAGDLHLAPGEHFGGGTPRAALGQDRQEEPQEAQRWRSCLYIASFRERFFIIWDAFWVTGYISKNLEKPWCLKVF